MTVKTKKVAAAKAIAAKPVKKPVAKPPQAMATPMAEWMDIIRRQGEEHRRKEEDRIKALMAAVPSQKKAIKVMTNKKLLDFFTNIPRYDSDSRALVIFEDMFQFTKREIARRLGP